MAFISWLPESVDCLFREHNSLLSMTTVDDLSYTPSTEEKFRDAAQIDVTGRRSWKTLKGKGEAVWPPNLEAALLEALEKYDPHAARPYAALGRFPMRNRFISDYIYETTGKRRTPKQVGSRLQQLRDTCKKSKLLDLISHRDSVGEITKAQSSTMPTRKRNSTPPSRHRPPNVVYVDILLNKKSLSPTMPIICLTTQESSAPIPVCLSSDRANPTPSVQPPTPCRHLDGLDPTLEFNVPYPLLLQTIFSVFFDGSDKPVHSEVGSLSCHSSPVEKSGWSYSSKLVPAFWETLRGDHDPTRYTIQQSIIPLRPLAPETPLNSPDLSTNSDLTFTIVYNFTLHAQEEHPYHIYSSRVNLTDPPTPVQLPIHPPTQLPTESFKLQRMPFSLSDARWPTSDLQNMPSFSSSREVYYNNIPKSPHACYVTCSKHTTQNLESEAQERFYHPPTFQDPRVPLAHSLYEINCPLSYPPIYQPF